MTMLFSDTHSTMVINVASGSSIAYVTNIYLNNANLPISVLLILLHKSLHLVC